MQAELRRDTTKVRDWLLKQMSRKIQWGEHITHGGKQGMTCHRTASSRFLLVFIVYSIIVFVNIRIHKDIFQQSQGFVFFRLDPLTKSVTCVSLKKWKGAELGFSVRALKSLSKDSISGRVITGDIALKIEISTDRLFSEPIPLCERACGKCCAFSSFTLPWEDECCFRIFQGDFF